jgi:thioredoxin reductase (NADPH)
LKKPALLVVDDDPQVLAAVARDVRRRYRENYRVLRASSGQEALEALRSLRDAGDPVALVISDQRMPKMEGVELLEQVRALFPTAKRTLLTAYSDTEAAIQAINRSHIDHYFVKPWDPPEEKLYPVLDGLLDDWQLNWRPGMGGLKVVADRWSARSHQIRDFLSRNLIPYTFWDVEASQEARGLRGDAELPLVIYEDGTRASDPSERDIAERLGSATKAQSDFYDLAVVGGGPAGLATAVYGGSEGLSTVLIEQSAPGGQAGTSSRIENYLGFPSGVSGSELTSRAVTQARKFGVEILAPRSVKALSIEGPYRHLELEDGSRLSCHALLLSMGVSWRRLPAEGADQFTDRGLYYGAALTEVENCANQVVYVVGAGNSAGQAAMRFAEQASKVVILVRGASLAAKMSQYLVDRIEQTGNIEVRLRSSVAACSGDGRLQSIDVEDPNGVVTESASYLFVFIGARPHTSWISDQVACDDLGFILTGPDLMKRHLADWPLERQPYLLETSIPGVFAAGDVRHDSVKRVASAVGEGSVSVHFVHRHLASL